MGLDDLPDETRSWIKLTKKMGYALAACLVAIGVLVAIVVSLSASNQVHASCKFAYDLSILPLAPNATSTGLTIVADARHWYDTANCDLGKLPPPDDRVVPYLKGK